MATTNRDNSPKILHIVHDEKFIDIAYRYFEDVFPNCNSFIAIGHQGGCKYIKETPVKRINRKQVFRLVIGSYTRQFDLVVFHTFNYRYEHLLALFLSRHIPLVWIGWGYDYYDLISKGDLNLLLKPLTRQVKEQVRQDMDNVKDKNDAIKSFVKRILFPRLKKLATRRIDFFSPVIFEDYKLVAEAAPWMRAQYIPWNYGVTFQEKLPEISNSSDHNILVGNSSSFENNHLDVFEQIAGFDFGDRKIICPLSYGNSEYKKYVLEKGYHLFGDKFIPLEEFTSLQEYISVLSTCSIFLMNHLRQQAAGNIALAFLVGGKVLLDTRNPLFDHYKNEGFKIFPINEGGNRHWLDVLSYEEKQNNRELILKRLDRKRILDKTKNLVQTALCGGKDKEIS